MTRSIRRLSLTVVVALVLTTGLRGDAETAEARFQAAETSLEFVPADASFYAASFGLKEQLDRFLATRAYAKLRTMPVVRMGWEQLKHQWNGSPDFAEAREFLAEADNQELLELMCDGLSTEVFVFGDESYGQWIHSLRTVQNTINLAQIQAVRLGRNPQTVVNRSLIKLVDENPNLTKIPTTVIGFKLSDVRPAVYQLDRLDRLVNQLISADPNSPLKGRFKRRAIAGGKYLSLDLDGTLVPWSQLLSGARLSSSVESRLIAKLQSMTLSVNVGLRGDFLIVSVGEDARQLGRFERGEHIASHPNLKPLRQYYDEDVTSIGYASPDFLRDVTAVKPQLKQASKVLTTLVSMAPFFDVDLRNEISSDIEQFIDELADLQTPPGALASISFLTPSSTGVDTVTFNWTANTALNDEQPLTILDNAGGDPILVAASRTQENDQSRRLREMSQRWFSQFANYVERFAMPRMDDDQQRQFSEIKERLQPLFQRLAVANRDQLGPAFADGQVAVVLDSQLSNARWHQGLPRADQPLPLPELSFVFGVNDPQAVRAGFDEYFGVTQDFLSLLSETLPEFVPHVQLPRPETRSLEVGQLYFYSLPPHLGLDSQITPNAGLSDDRLAFSFVPQATERVLTDTPLKRAGVLTEGDQARLAAATQFKFHRIVQMLRPWVKYGLDQAARQGQQDLQVTEQVNTVLDLLECVRTISSKTYREAGAIVTHSRVEYRDLP